MSNALVKTPNTNLTLVEAKKLYDDEYVGDAQYMWPDKVMDWLKTGRMVKKYGISIEGKGQDAIVSVKLHCSQKSTIVGTFSEVVTAAIINGDVPYETVVGTPKGTPWTAQMWHTITFKRAVNNWLAKEYAKLLETL